MSEFYGGFFSYIGWKVLIALFTLITLGFGFAFIYVKYLKWIADNTLISGRDVAFVGKASELFVKIMLWGLLTLVTLGIFGLIVPMKTIKWKIANLKIV